jgi:Family of unknown function (DUF6504)
MRRIRGEPVEVWLRHGRPARFVWRGRLYTVLFVHDRRVSGLPPPAGPPPAGPPPAGPPPAGPPPPAGSPAPAAEDAGLDYWLVEATPARAAAAALYELRHDGGTGRWTLSRN